MALQSKVSSTLFLPFFAMVSLNSLLFINLLTILMRCFIFPYHQIINNVRHEYCGYFAGMDRNMNLQVNGITTHIARRLI